MAISVEGKIGLALGLVALGGGGAIAVAQGPIVIVVGWVLITTAFVGAVILAHHHFGRRKMAALWGMIFFGLGFIVCAAWYFWPVAKSETESKSPQPEIQVSVQKVPTTPRPIPSNPQTKSHTLQLMPPSIPQLTGNSPTLPVINSSITNSQYTARQKENLIDALDDLNVIISNYITSMNKERVPFNNLQSLNSQLRLAFPGLNIPLRITEANDAVSSLPQNFESFTQSVRDFIDAHPNQREELVAVVGDLNATGGIQQELNTTSGTLRRSLYNVTQGQQPLNSTNSDGVLFGQALNKIYAWVDAIQQRRAKLTAQLKAGN